MNIISLLLDLYLLLVLKSLSFYNAQLIALICTFLFQNLFPRDDTFKALSITKFHSFSYEPGGLKLVKSLS